MEKHHCSNFKIIIDSFFFGGGGGGVGGVAVPNFYCFHGTYG